MTGAPHEARFSFDYADERRARIVARSLDPEVTPLSDDRSRASLARDGATLALAVEAGDLVALRAAANTWLTLVDVAERVAEYRDF